MTRKSVGYFEGTDSELLTHLIMAGYDTIPVSNGLDHHGTSLRSNFRSQSLSIIKGHKVKAL